MRSRSSSCRSVRSTHAAKHLHPDVNKECDANEFAKLAESFKVLSNADRRAKYDDEVEAGQGKIKLMRFSIGIHWVFL